jgi:hypothetical protein
MHWLRRLGGLLLALTISASRLEAIPSETLDGISFADDPHVLFVPIEEIASALRWEMQMDQESGQISLNGHLLDAAHRRKLVNGTLLVALDELQRAGATITWSNDGMEALVASDHTKMPTNGSRWIWRTSACAHIKEHDSSSTAPSAQDERARRRRREISRLGQSNRGCTAHGSTTTRQCRGACRCRRIFSFTDSGKSPDVPPHTVAFACR